MSTVDNLSGGCAAALVVALVTSIPAWVTHVVVCIQSEQWIFLLAGAIFAPIGVIHGWGIWFGVF